jgi:hypothetical protein
MAEDRRDVGLLAITSADRLYAEWTAAQRARESGLVHSRSHIERLLAGWVPRRASYEIPRHFGRTGSLVDLYRHSVPTLSSPRHNLPPSEGPLKVAATRCMRRSCVELLESCNDTERLRVIPRHQCASLRRGDAWRQVALRTNIRYGSALNRFKKSRPPPQPLLSANSTDRRHAASVTWSQPGSRQAENA